MRTILKDRTGERFTTDFGDSGTIVRYVNQHEIYVVFDGSTHMIKCEYKQLKRLDNPMRPTIYGIGYIGVGEYTGLKRSGNSLHIKYYKLWCSMMARCYGNVVNTRQTYESCIVCEEWHNYQNFAKWCENNYYEVLQEKCVSTKISWLRAIRFIVQKLAFLFQTGSMFYLLKMIKPEGNTLLEFIKEKILGNLQVNAVFLEMVKKDINIWVNI